MTATIDAQLVRGSALTTELPLGSLTVLPDGQAPRPGQRLWRFLTPKDGDKRIVWDPDDLAQIRDAKNMFNEAAAQGMVPYVCGADGRPTANIMDEFDPGAGEVVFIPIGAVAGG